MAWSDLTEWWLSELTSDDAYEEVVTPLLLHVLSVDPGACYLDVGSGEGRVARSIESVGGVVIGLEINESLARHHKGSVVGDVLQDPLVANSFEGAYAVLVLEHLADIERFFSRLALVVRPGGTLAIVSNHPVWTAPGSTPIDDDEELLWRPGEYFSEGVSRLTAGGGEVVFHHRSVSAILNAAAETGWSLEEMEERPHHELKGQQGIPRLIACRWRLLP